MSGHRNLPYLELPKTLSWIQWYKNIDLARENMSNKLMLFKSNRKNGGILLFCRKRCLKRIKGYNTKEGGATNEGNNVIAQNVLSYF